MKDPYFKPVIFSGLLITVLSIVFAPAIFLWALVGGYLAVRLAIKTAKHSAISVPDGAFLGLFSGLIGGACLDIITVISFNSFENRRLLIKTLEKNWPHDVQPLTNNIAEMLPAILTTTCLLVVVISTIFAILGAILGVVISRRRDKTHGVKN